MKIRVEEYTRRDGSSPYADWFNSLDAQAAANIVAAELRMELGNTSSIKWNGTYLSRSDLRARG